MRFQFKQLFDGTREKLRRKPEKRIVEILVVSRQCQGFESAVDVRDFTVAVDQPAKFGGTNKGPKPSEYVLAALAACQETTYRLYADALGISLDGVSVRLTGKQDLRGFLGLDDKVRAGFQEIQGIVEVDSPASEADLLRLKEAVDTHCPVLDDLRAPVPITLGLQRSQNTAPKRSIGSAHT